MFELELNSGKKGRIWLDEVPPTGFTAQKICEATVDICEATTATCGKPHQAAIELRLFQGSRPVYGFLGAKFSPEETQKLLIQVAVGENETPSFQEFLAVAPEIIQIGISEEYVPAILKKALEVQEELSSVPSGKITFNCAAHGLFSSNLITFGFLSQTIMLTIGLLCKETPQDKVLKFVESMINDF
ncbi:hypothetical protein AB3R30_20100 [Leptolyngbyaceae cyanobacterium UHCC 1019]